jgi:sec-independent protein translocase protein TatC
MMLSDMGVGVLLPWNLASMIALWISIPWIIYQVLLFVSPALYNSERKAVLIVALIGCVLFVVGTAFGVFVVVPWLVHMVTPLVLYALLCQEWVTPDGVRRSRCWWVPGLFVCSMILTPPDVISQIVLALPMWGLIESSLFVYVYILKNLPADQL